MLSILAMAMDPLQQTVYKATEREDYKLQLGPILFACGLAFMLMAQHCIFDLVPMI